MNMRVQRVDPRYVNQTFETPIYRVDFWTDSSASDEWRLSGVEDYEEALQWADENANGRSIVIYAEIVLDIGQPVLVRVHGREPV